MQMRHSMSCTCKECCEKIFRKPVIQTAPDGDEIWERGGTFIHQYPNARTTYEMRAIIQSVELIRRCYELPTDPRIINR